MKTTPGKTKGSSRHRPADGAEAPERTAASGEVFELRLYVAGQTPTSGVLLISGEGGESANVDNIVSYQAEGNGWDKPADINVQVFAHRVDGRTAPRPKRGQ